MSMKGNNMNYTISPDSINWLIEACKNESDDLKIVFDVLLGFENYHQAVIRETGFHKVFLSKGAVSQELQESYGQYDKSRSIAHNGAIVYLQMLIGLSVFYKTPQIYAGPISEDHPHRRDIGDAILQYLHELAESRF